MLETVASVSSPVLSSIAASLRAELDVSNDEWAGSTWEWVKNQPPRRRGKIGERLVCAAARTVGLTVGSGGAGADCRLGPLLVEVKLSTRWQDGKFVFQQLRDQNYGCVALVGVEPERLRIWVVPKDVLWNLAEGQHTGADAVETRWWGFHADCPPTWLASYGGDFETARALLANVAAAS